MKNKVHSPGTGEAVSTLEAGQIGLLKSSYELPSAVGTYFIGTGNGEYVDLTNGDIFEQEDSDDNEFIPVDSVTIEREDD